MKVRACQNRGCDKSLPSDAASQRRFCSNRCQVAEWRRRTRQQADETVYIMPLDSVDAIRALVECAQHARSHSWEEGAEVLIEVTERLASVILPDGSPNGECANLQHLNGMKSSKASREAE